jgi:branched-chain amino acid transport system substrate-binding protein
MENAGAAAEGVLVGTAWNKVSADKPNADFLALMKARGHEPDQFCTQAYVGVQVVAEAIRLSGQPTREGVRAGFLKLKDLPTPLGRFSFQASRDGDHSPAVQVVKGGKFQILQ